MKLGYTGTREGMTYQQIVALHRILDKKNPDTCIHGDCIGGDAEFHNISRRLRKQIEIYPPIKPSLRAFCTGDIMHLRGEYINRNHEIVDASDVMIATPKQDKEILKSGTWNTIRYAKKVKKELYIIYLDGSVEEVSVMSKT